MHWKKISQVKYLSYDFIKKYKDCVDWKTISKYQKLDEDFMREFQNYIDWDVISTHQKLSENFICEFKSFVNWNEVVYKTRFTNEDLLKNVIKFGNWLYIDNKTKKLLVKNVYNMLKINGKKWIECYKVVNSDYSDIGNSHDIYDKLNTIYETECNYNYYNPSGPGFSCWSRQKAKYFVTENKKIIKVLLPFNSVCMVKNESIRSNKMIVTDLNVVF